MQPQSEVLEVKMLLYDFFFFVGDTVQPMAREKAERFGGRLLGKHQIERDKRELKTGHLPVVIKRYDLQYLPFPHRSCLWVGI